MANKIKKFFNEFEAVWEAIPGYVKVFIYSTSSSIIGAYVATGKVDSKTVILVVLANLGLYQGTREGVKQIRKML